MSAMLVRPMDRRGCLFSSGDKSVAGERRVRRGPRVITARNAEKGHPRQLFVDHPSCPPGSLACLCCMTKFPDEPTRYSFKLEAGPANAWKHLNGVHGIYDHVGADRADKKQGAG